MAIRLPRLRREVPIVEEAKGPSQYFQRTLDTAFKQIEGSVTRIDLALAAAGLALDQSGQPLRLAARTVAANTTATATDYFIAVNATSGVVTVTLPAVATSDGQIIVVKKVDSSANAVTVDANSSETIDGATTQMLIAQYDSVTLICDSAEWWII